MRRLCLDRSFGIAKRFYTNELDHDALTTSTTVQTLNTQRETPRQKRRITLTCWMGGSVSSDYDMQTNSGTIIRIATFALATHGSPKLFSSCNKQGFPTQNNRPRGKKEKTWQLHLDVDHATLKLQHFRIFSPRQCSCPAARTAWLFQAPKGAIYHQCSRDAYRYVG